MKFKLSFISVSLLFALSSHGIIVRHDVAPGEYEIKAGDIPAVFFLERQGIRRVCAATVIHERWALTAAHCVAETTLGDTIKNGRRFAVDVGNQIREIDAVLIHPDFEDGENSEVDLALLRFRNESITPRPIEPYADSNESGEIVTLVGWGYFGVGTTGRQFDNGTKRRAKNRISLANNRLRFVFDDPRVRGTDALPLEGTLGLGDSGGPALIETSTGFRLAGIAIGEVGGDQFSEETQGRYGSIAVYERVSLHLDWINTILGSES
jgi:secreted trypsin-like serine protease